MAIKKLYKIITPATNKVSVTDNQDLGGNFGLYGNYSWYHKLIQGSSVRLMRYREFDLMSIDIQVARALDIIAEEVVGLSSESELPLKLMITAGRDESISSNDVITLKSALKTWCKIHNWKKRLFYIVRTTLKYGDVFFLKQAERNNKSYVYINPKNVVGGIVDRNDINSVLGWQIKRDTNVVSDMPGFSYSNLNNDSPQSFTSDNIESDRIVRFTLHDEMSEESPFGVSILAEVYRDFKRKELLEDAIIIYRIRTAPEKRVFKIDMGNLPLHKRAAHLEQMKNEIKQKKIPSPYGGRNQVESIYNPQSSNEDFFFAKGKNGEGSTVELLPGGKGLGELTELDYFYNKLWIGLKIPKSYIENGTDGGTYNDGAVGIAYMAELQFNQYIERLQPHFDTTLDTEFKNFLLQNGIRIDPTIYQIRLPTPQNFSKYRERAMNNAMINTYSSISNEEHLAKRFILQKFLGLTREEMIINERLKAEELGLDPNMPPKNLVKIYRPENGEVGGFDGGIKPPISGPSISSVPKTSREDYEGEYENT